MKSQKWTAICLATLAIGLGASTAEARRVPGWAGTADPPGSGNCWSISAGRLKLACYTAGDHFYQVPLALDSTNSLTASWQQGYDGFSTGTVMGRVASINQDGTVLQAPAYQSGVGLKTQTIFVPNNGTAMLTIDMQAPGGLSNAYVSYITWTP